MTKTKINIFWFRRDLRLEDNIGLYNCLKQGLPVLAIFIFDKEILSKLDKNDKRVHFIHDSLSQIKLSLNKVESDLICLYNTPKLAWEELLQKYDVNCVFTNEDYEPYALKRDSQIKKMLQINQIEFLQFKDQCIFAKKDIVKADGTPYVVYTAYKNQWLAKLMPEHILSFNCKKFHSNFLKTPIEEMIPLDKMGFNDSHTLKLKKTLKKSVIENYHLFRDIPKLDATTKVGVHLRFGTISVRKCVQVARELNQVWLEELIWREFFMQILYNFPHASKGPFKEKYNGIKWINKKSEFKKWCEGKTGYPLVDAGMRELNETGHMHNRVRMVTASFLVKDLLIDWKWGEKYFAKMLLDYDQSSNNGNWQWVAGTGCDSAPYFRIFNPDTQLKKFDPDHEYIKRWIPEYGTDEYPDKMIDHNMAYHRALRVIKDGIS